MGEIVIKVPGDVREEIDLGEEGLEKVMERVDLVFKALRQHLALKKLNEMVGVLPEDFSVSEEELYSQRD